MTPPPVTEADVSPNGSPLHCFWCGEPVGGQHAYTCVRWTRRVRIVVEIELEREYPMSWDRHDIEFHGNESSWCASNIVDDIAGAIDRLTEEGKCLCGSFTLRVAGEAP